MAIKKIWREAGKKTFSVVIGGDVCPREENSDYVADHAAEIVLGVKPAFKADALKILQWECAVTEGGEPIVKSGPNLRCPEKVLNVMSELDIDVALLANNHIGDYSPSEVFTTIDNIEKRWYEPLNDTIKSVVAAFGTCKISNICERIIAQKNRLNK